MWKNGERALIDLGKHSHTNLLGSCTACAILSLEQTITKGLM